MTDDYGKVEESLSVKLNRLEAENAALRAKLDEKSLTMSSERDISLASSDVLHHTSPRIAKPPNYREEEESEEDDDGVIDGPVPSPRRKPHSAARNGENSSESAKQNETAVVVDDEVRGKGKVSSRHHKDDDHANEIENDDSGAAHATNGVETSVLQEKMKDDEEKEEDDDGREEIVRDGADGGGEEGKGERKRHESWVMLSKDEDKEKENKDDDSAGDNDDDRVSVLVDRVEHYVEETSKGDKRAFDGLVAVLSILLPKVLFMDDDLDMQKKRGKDLILRNRVLQKDVQQLRHDAAKRARAEMTSVGVSAMAGCEICDHGKEEIVKEKGSATDPVDGDKGGDESKVAEATEAEMKKLRFQCRELQHVNHSWEKYFKKQTQKHQAELKKRSDQLAVSEQTRKKAEKRLEEKFREYDQTLLQTKVMLERQKALAVQYKVDRDGLRPKYEELKRQLKEQDEEIKRLNQVIERKIQTKVYKVVKASELSAVVQQAHVVDEEKQRNVSTAPPMTAAVNPPPYQEKRSAKMKTAALPQQKAPQQKAPRRKTESPPLSPRGPPVHGNGSEPMSLTREELKDQVVLFKEQMDVYRSDFNQERRDREKAIGEVDSLKKELEKTKIRLKEIHKQRKQEEHNFYAAARGAGEINFLPEDTQEMRMREIKQQAKLGRRHPAYGREYADGYEDHLYAEFD